MAENYFTKAAAPPKGLSGSRFLEAILSERPDLQDQMAYFPEQGGCALTVIIGNEVFKIDSKQIPHLENMIIRERDALRCMEGKGLPVPALTYVGKDLPFFGMTRVAGQHFSPEIVQVLPEADKERLAKYIAAFCVDLSNAVSDETAKETGIDTQMRMREETDADALRAKMAVPGMKDFLGPHYDFFNEVVEAYIEESREKYASGGQYFMHADFKSGNILYDPETKSITGFIDFGVSCLTRPDDGLSSLYFSYPPDFADRVLKEYSRLQPIEITPRDIHFWRCILEVNNISRGLKNLQSDPEGYERWKKTMQEYAGEIRDEMRGIQLSEHPHGKLAQELTRAEKDFTRAAVPKTAAPQGINHG